LNGRKLKKIRKRVISVRPRSSVSLIRVRKLMKRKKVTRDSILSSSIEINKINKILDKHKKKETYLKLKKFRFLK